MADIAASSWDTNDDDNNQASPLGAPEGMLSSGVNNTIRAMMGATKRLYTYTVPTITTGTAAAYLVTYSVAPSALHGNGTHLLQFHAVNSAGATLNIAALGAKPLHYYSVGAWRAVPAALLGANQVLRVTYNTAASAYRIIELPDRTGEVVAFAGATAPAGSLFCFGQAVSRTAYAGLFAALSTAHGVGDGSTTFNLPDLRGRVAAGKGNMGGTESGRLTGAVASTLGAAGGAQTHTLTAAEVAVHKHSEPGGTSGFLVPNAGTNFGTAGVASATVGYTNQTGDNAPVGGGAHNNVQPTMALNYVIRI